MIEDRFKLRAWDKIKKEMFEVSMIDFCQKGYIWNETDNTSMETQNNLAYEVDNCVLMQCTGLRDKNGKLIFEKDILKDPKTLQNYEVDFMQGFFGIPCKDCRWYPLFEFRRVVSSSKYVNIYLEIIGNRFENSELLKGDK